MVFRDGDFAYMVSNGHNIVRVKVAWQAGGLYTVALPSGGWIRLRPSRLFASEEEARNSIRKASCRPGSEGKPKLQDILPYV